MKKKKISLKKHAIRKNPLAIMTPEQYNNQNKNSWMNSRVEWRWQKIQWLKWGWIDKIYLIWTAGENRLSRTCGIKQKTEIQYSCHSPRPWESEVARVIKEIITESFPKLMRDIKVLIQEDLITQNMINPKKLILRHIIINIWKLKIKEKALKSSQK